MLQNLFSVSCLKPSRAYQLTLDVLSKNPDLTHLLVEAIKCVVQFISCNLRASEDVVCCWSSLPEAKESFLTWVDIFDYSCFNKQILTSLLSLAQDDSSLNLFAGWFGGLAASQMNFKHEFHDRKSSNAFQPEPSMIRAEIAMEKLLNIQSSMKM